MERVLCDVCGGVACTWQFPGISKAASPGLSLPVLLLPYLYGTRFCGIKLSSSRNINCLPLRGYIGLFFNKKDLFRTDVIPETRAPSQRCFPVLSYHKYLLKNSYSLTLVVFCAARSLQPIFISMLGGCGVAKHGGGYWAALQPGEPAILLYLKPALLNSVECNPRRKLL